MKKFIFILILLICELTVHASDSQWRLHPTFNGNLERIIDTPRFTYLLSRNQMFKPGNPDYGFVSNSLFRYDKEEKETLWLSSQNLLSSQVVTTAEYNFDKRYLMVAYNNGDIDLIYDDGTVKNIPGLRETEGYSKNINSITFKPGDDICFLATDFGYMVVNDRKGEIASSRVLDKKVNAVTQYNGKIYIAMDEGLFQTDSRAGSELVRIGDDTGIKRFFPLGVRLYVFGGEGIKRFISYLEEVDGKWQLKPFFIGDFKEVETTDRGLLAISAGDLYLLDKNSSSVKYSLPKELQERHINGNESGFWVDMGLEGVVKMQYLPDNPVWKPLNEIILPNASNAYKSTSMAYSDRYGMLVRNHGYDQNFLTIEPATPDYLSALRNMEWTPMSITVRNPELNVFAIGDPNGLVIDPDDSDMVYCGSILSGILRLNLADPSKSLRMGRNNDPDAGKQGFVGVVEGNKLIPHYTPFGTPAFDSDGNLWITYNNLDSGEIEIWYWTPADRKASVSASTYRPMKKLPYKMKGSNISLILPLKTTANKNIVLAVSYGDNSIRVIDHKGTLDNPNDDSVYYFPFNVLDQDGGVVDTGYIRSLYEDPHTGNVWVGSERALFYFNPLEARVGNDIRVNRVKVPRNDGTNYADYLLDGASVNVITHDGKGRKWFGTNGGGLVCTSASGTEILMTYTSDNSLLPGNRIYGLCYNPSDNSMMISTDAGLAQLYLSSGSGNGEKGDEVKIYPNPVRPDFYGYVRIEGLEDDALVKIIDSGGNLIKELGRAPQGNAEWDVTNLYNKRVRSGVYYVMASGTADSSGYASVAKILVVN